jgi:hypothetical protein
MESSEQGDPRKFCPTCQRFYAPKVGHVCGTIVDRRFRCPKCNRALGISTVEAHVAVCKGRRELTKAGYTARAKRIKAAVMRAAGGGGEANP